MRRMPLVMLGTFALPCFEAVSAQQALFVDVNSSAQPLDSALRTWSEQSRHQVLLPPAAGGQTASEVKGRYVTLSAQEALLADIGMSYQLVNARTLAAQPAEGDVRDRPAGQDSAGGDAGNKDKELEEVLVTAQKRVERLVDVPVPVTVVAAEALADTGKLRLQNYYTQVPGLNLVAAGDGGPLINMRGIASSGQTAPTVAITVDDVPYGGSNNTGTAARAPDIDPGDLVRIEALRGPQGTLYGASSIGGLLKFVTIDPSTDGYSGRLQGGMASIEHGEVGYTFRGSFNAPVTDTFAVRFSGFTARDPGYVDNIQTGESDTNRRKSNGGRVAALWRPSDVFSVKLAAAIQDSDRSGPTEVDSALGGQLAVAALSGTGIYGRRSEIYSIVANGNFGDTVVTSVSAYNIDKFNNRGDVSRLIGGLALANFGTSSVAAPFYQRSQKFTQELRASIPLTERITWLAGVFYDNEKAHTHLDYLASTPSTGDPVGTLLTVDQPTTFEEYAAFTDFTFVVTDRFDIQVGGRLSKNRQSFSSVRSGVAAPLFYGANPSILPENSFSDNPATYLLTPRFKMTPDLVAYARFASGYRAGGPNANCSSAIPCQFSADTTENYELGIKGDLAEHRFSFDASVYYIDWKDVQINVRSATAPVIYTANAGKAKSQGAELSLEAEPIAGLTLSSVFSWSDAELTENFPGNPPAAVAFRGDRLPYSTPFSGSFSVQQDVRVTADVSASFAGTFSYVGERTGTFRTTALRAKYPSYTQLDLRAGARFGSSWSADLYVNNVADKRGILNGGLEANAPTYYTYIDPRTYGISITKTFGNP